MAPDIEKALQRIGRAFGYAIKNIKWDGPHTLEGSPLSVIKLHGSINWYQSDQNTISVADDPWKLISDPSLYPLLTPPTWNKSSFLNILPQLWQSAVNAISRATRIIVIGYSMPQTDPYFKYLLAAGLKDNYDLQKFSVINPTSLDRTYGVFLDSTYFSFRRMNGKSKFFEGFLSDPQDVFNTLGRGELLTSVH